MFVYLFQVDSAADWDKAAHLIYNPEHPSWEEDPEQVFFVHSSFTPSAVPFSPKAYGKKVCNATMVELVYGM